MTTWPSVSLSEISAKPQYGAIAKGIDTPGGPQLVRQTDIVGGRVDWTSVPYCDLDADSVERYSLNRGDLLISRLGNGVGNAVTVMEDRADAVFAGYLVRFQPDPAIADARFVGYQLQSQRWREHVLSYRSGAAQPTLNAKQMGQFTFPLPALEDQRAIAATLGALDDKIESNRRTISMIDELVRARFQVDFDMSQAADGVSVADLVPVNRKLKLSRGKKATYIGMSSLPEFSPEILDWESREFGSGQKFVNGDVLMARITPCLENGKTAIVDMLEDGEVGWGSTEYVVLSPKGLITTPWIYALARHELVREWAIRRMTGTSGRQRFQAAGFSDYRIAEPDQKRLEEFNSFAVPLFNRITQLRNEIKRLTNLRDTLLPELLSGRVSMSVGEVAS